MRGKKATTYLPPELVARMDALLQEEGGTRSSLLRQALKTCLTDLAWLRVTGLPRKLALTLGRDPGKVEEAIAALRSKKEFGYPGLSRRLRLKLKLEEREPARNAQGELAKILPPPEPQPGRLFYPVGACLPPDCAGQLEELAAVAGVSRSELLQVILDFFVSDVERDKRLAQNEQYAREMGITPDDVVRLVKEARAERRAEALREGRYG